MQYLKGIKNYIKSKFNKPKPEIIKPEMTPIEVKTKLRDMVDMKMISYIEYLLTKYSDAGYECGVEVFSAFYYNMGSRSIYYIYKDGKLNTKTFDGNLHNIKVSIYISLNSTFHESCYRILKEVVGKLRIKYPDCEMYEGDYKDSDTGLAYVFLYAKEDNSI